MKRTGKSRPGHKTNASQADEGRKSETPMFHDPRTKPLLWAFVQQIGWLFFLELILDEGVLLSAARAPSVGFWSGVLFILIRRPACPTNGEILFIRWGLFPIMLVGLFVQMQVWTAQGRFARL
jgi:hypothetical protein